ncbi:MAG: hypothetical protein RIR26_2305 [Pseudomonadota bacterium]|jgi:hypothetical protein
MRHLELSILAFIAAVFSDALGAQSAAVQGQTRQFRIDLTKIEPVKTNPNSILAVESLLVENEETFGSIPRFRGTSLAHIGMSVKSRGPSPASSSLRLSFTNQGGITAESCQIGFTICRQMKMSSTGKNQFLLNIDNSEIEVRPEREPCTDGLTKCQLDIPSWALSGLITNKGWPEIPEVLTLVQQPTALLLVNGITGQHFSTIQLADTLPRGTRMKSAAFNRDGTLRIVFAASVLLIDFNRDQLLMATPQGVMLGSRGAAGGSVLSFSKFLDNGSSQNQPPLFLNASFAVWPDESGRIARDSDGTPSLGQKSNRNKASLLQVSETNEGLAEEAFNREGKADVSVVDVSRGDVLSNKTYGLTGGPSQMANTLLVGRTLYQLTSSGFYIYGDSSLVPFVRGNQPSQMKILDEGHIFWPQNKTQGCTLVHEIQNMDAPQLSQPTALSLPCSALESIRTGHTGVVASERKGNQLTNTVWTTRPASPVRKNSGR